MATPKKIVTTTLVIRMRADDIIETHPNPDFSGVVSEAHARENIMAIEGISNHRWYPILNYLPDHEVSEEAQHYYANCHRTALAAALISKSMIQSLLGNIMITIRGLDEKLPTKMFSKSEDAERWLEKQRGLLQHETNKSA